jgi:ParB family protein of integrating conjugative element (PFGI_1 class)
MRTPETLTAVRRAEHLKRQQAAQGTATSADSTHFTKPQDSMNAPADKPMNAQQARLAAAKAALHTSTRNATADINPMDEADGAVTILSIDDIVTYSHNPRSKPNPKRADLKASLAAEGITNMISVTRRSPKEKYFPYGGGNTRVELAKELFAEGDSKFATMTVITKKWPGEAAVISAHLSENDNRGDITFWERAQGVIKFKEQFEQEHGQPLSATELNKELKQRGLNYGIKMIQNFVFSVEELALIGPWLRTEDLNTIIRPAVSAFIDLSEKFDKKKEIKNQMDSIFLMHGNDLETLDTSNKEKDPAERQDSMLDVPSLITDLQSVVAKVVHIDVDNMPAAMQLLAANPKASAEELKAAKLSANNVPTTTKKQPKQSPLSGMLGKVSNKKTDSNTEPDNQAENATLDAFGKQLISDITALNNIVPIADFLIAEPRLPYGFFVDFPESMDYINGQKISEEMAGQREALWPLMACFSGQANETLAACLPAESKWAQTKLQGVQAMKERCHCAGVVFSTNGSLVLTSMHIWMVLSHPTVGPAFSALLKTMSAYHQQFPEKFSSEFKLLFS